MARGDLALPPSTVRALDGAPAVAVPAGRLVLGARDGALERGGGEGGGEGAGEGQAPQRLPQLLPPLARRPATPALARLAHPLAASRLRPRVQAVLQVCHL